MKNKRNKAILAVIILVAVLIITATFNRPQIVLQYVVDGEMITEIYHSSDSLNKRISELEKSDITTYFINN